MISWLYRECIVCSRNAPFCPQVGGQEHHSDINPQLCLQQRTRVSAIVPGAHLPLLCLNSSCQESLTEPHVHFHTNPIKLSKHLKTLRSSCLKQSFKHIAGLCHWRESLSCGYSARECWSVKITIAQAVRATKSSFSTLLVPLPFLCLQALVQVYLGRQHRLIESCVCTLRVIQLNRRDPKTEAVFALSTLLCRDASSVSRPALVKRSSLRVCQLLRRDLVNAPANHAPPLINTFLYL